MINDEGYSLTTTQKAWLTKHPNVSQQWLVGAQSEGFELHHIDCNHDNDSPDNILLIFGRDHKYIHGISSSFGLMANKSRDAWICKRESDYIRIKLGEKGYTLRQSGMKWPDVGIALGYAGRRGQQGGSAANATRQYAKYNKLTWPIELT